MNETDRKDLEQHKGTLERSHNQYLMQTDPEILEQINNQSGVPVFFAQVEYTFGGLAMMERTPCLYLDNEVKAFKAHAGKAIFVLFFGVVNHWISIVVQKPAAEAAMEIYMLDSSNI